MSGTPSFEQSEWLDACTSHGQNTYAYGNSLQFGRCNDGTRSAPTTDPVASNSECQSSYVAYRGVFDLNGNVWEWENNCHSSMGASDVCNPRGTSFGVSAAAPLCSATLPVTRGGALKNVGFRCCSG